MVGQDGGEAVSAYPEVAAAFQFTRPQLPEYALVILSSILNYLYYWWKCLSRP